MAFEKLQDGLRGAIKNLRKAVVLDKRTVKEYVKQIQKTLISSDVSIQLVQKISKQIEDRGLLEKPPGLLSRQENLVKITYEELTNLLGEGGKLLVEDGQRILLVGVQGSGKTTQAAKLARYFKKQGLNPKLICADTFRPAAYDQLKQLSEEIHVPFYGEKGEKDSLTIINRGVDHHKTGLIIIDSEGRHKLDKSLMSDINRVAKNLKPDKTLLVLDGTIGQTAGEHAKAFKEACSIDGVIVSKLDGTAKGGGALSACAETGAKVFFIGVGEHIQDLELFDPKRFVGRIIGFGDIEGLMEKAKEVDLDEETAKRMMSGKFTLQDLYYQIEQMKKMGPMSNVLDMLPMGGKLPKDMVDLQEDKIKKFKVIMDSMTEEEMEDPQLIKQSRIERIAKGSGTTQAEVRELLNHYKRMKKVMKSVGSGRKLERLMKKFGMNMGG
ncbi:MAG: signal recognition particle protein Srp54 [Methanobacteriota archaeon]